MPDAWRSGGLATELGGVLYLINVMVALDLPNCFEEGWTLASGVGAWGLLEALARELLGAAFPERRHDPLWGALAALDGRKPGQLPGARLPRTRPRRWPAFRLPEAWLAGLPDGERVGWRAGRGRRHKPGGDYAPLLGRWLALAMPFIAYRLRLALDRAQEVDLAGSLLALHGTLHLSSSHVDLVVSLNDASLPVRRAGLDRDPGWLPDFGRVVYLHFE